MVDRTQLERSAEQCERLATVVTFPQAADLFRAHAAKYRAQAERLRGAARVHEGDDESLPLVVA